MNLRSILTALIASTAALHAQQPGVTAETWTGLTPGKSILILQKEGISTRAPNTTRTLAETRITGLPANSGTRLRATLTPTADDNYTFWVNGTDNVALWISEDGTPFTKHLIAHHLGATAATEWGKFPTQKSQAIALAAGVTYHLEAHVMTSVANGHLAVAWQGSKGNWALAANGATATQSTTQWGLDASKAIDGNTNGAWREGTMTTNVQNSWLRVNFAAPRPLNRIILHNNSNDQLRLSNFRLTAHDGTGATLAQQDFFTTSGNAGTTFAWEMPATVQASSIRIQLLGNNRANNGFLALAEIQAFGSGPYETTRAFQIISSAFLAPAATNPADTNSNHLPDTWEQQTGLASSVLPGSLREYGDPDNDGLTNYEENLYGSNPLVAELMADGLIRSMWTDETTSANVWSFVRNRPRFLSYPSETKFLPNIDDRPTYTNSGYRYRGYITAPTTGMYRFWIAGTNDSELWLADGTVKHPATGAPLTNRFGKQRLAAGGYVTPLRDFDYSEKQRSQAIQLTAGQTYYIEVLQKIAQGGNHHVSVAWTPPGQPRAIIPTTAYTANAPDPLDADDDNLPDTWETAYGLNPANNGRTAPADGEYGDSDNDKLTNLEEYQYRSHPRSADGDNDGISDSDEIRLYRTNPLVSDAIPTTTHSILNLHQPAATSFPWQKNSDGTITAYERRGWLEWPITIAPGQQGIHEIRLVASMSASMSVPLSFRINDQLIDRRNHSLTTTANTSNPIKILTPYLPAGTHILRLENHNTRADRRLRIHGLRTFRFGGADANANGIADWIETRFQQENQITILSTSSLTSPAYVEGVATLTDALRLSYRHPNAEATALSAQNSIRNIFHSHIPLHPSASTEFQVSFDNGESPVAHNITWAATNILEHNTLTIAKGQSLRLTAHAGITPEGTFTLTTGGAGFQSVSSSAKQPHILRFDQPGIYTLTATWTPEGDGTPQTNTLTLHVRSADLGAPFVLQINNRRTWQIANLRNTIVEADPAIHMPETSATTSTDPRSFLTAAYQAGEYRVTARCQATNHILAVGRISAFSLARVAETGDAQIIETRSDGSALVRFTIVAENLPANAEVRLYTNYQGSTFLDGSRSLILRPGDFSSNGIAEIIMETSSNPPQLCHSLNVFLIN